MIFASALWEFKNMGDVLLFSLVAILLVFAILALIILVSWLFSKGIQKVEVSNNIFPRPENKILETDEDAVAAVLVATIDFHKEFNKDAKLISIQEIDE